MLRKLYVEEEEEEDFGPIYDTDGEGEFCERINFLFEEEFIEKFTFMVGDEIIEDSSPIYDIYGEEDHEEIEEEINFVLGNEIDEKFLKEKDFVVTNKIVEEKVEEFKEVEQVLDHEDVVVVKKDDDTRLITNRLSENLEEGVTHQVPSSKQLRGREFIMLGFLFLWCTFSWEAMLLEHVVHQPTSTNHDLIFHMAIVNPLSYFKNNLLGPNLVHGSVRKWFLIHKWKTRLGFHLASSFSYLKNMCMWRRDQLGVKKMSHSAIKICFQDLLSWKVCMGEQQNLVLTELRTIPFEE
ncbi:unnamed protein product [Lactuca saligna]|uniref:Uncharacterized protein n=1 Tax=Lactuca saligna TaxID=75948 RepID=A0AA35US68_LACSI|nr:unnamed protein product [Lactuca saligna]